MDKSHSMSTSFTDRVKSRASQPAQSVTVVEEENDFPFESIDFIRIGSAHTLCDLSQDDENADLLLRVSSHIMSRYEPDLMPARVAHRTSNPIRPQRFHALMRSLAPLTPT